MKHTTTRAVIDHYRGKRGKTTPAPSINAVLLEVFGQHRLYAVCRCGPFLHMSHVGIRVSCEKKTAEPIEMPFGGQTYVGQKEPPVRRGPVIHMNAYITLQCAPDVSTVAQRAMQ